MTALTVLAVPLLLYWQISALGPAIRAGHDQGIRGTFTAQQYSCYRFTLCHWNGLFVARHGRTRLEDVTYDGDMPGGGHPGIVVPALDSGDPDTVYPAGGSNAWIGDLLELAAIATGAVLFIVLMVWMEWTIRSASKPLTAKQRQQTQRLVDKRNRQYERRHERQRRNPLLRDPEFRGPGRHTPS